MPPCPLLTSFLLQSIQAASSVLNIFVEKLVPTGFLRFAPDCYYVFAGFASAFLLKLTQPKFHNVLESSQRSRIFELVGRLVKALSHIGDEKSTPALYSKFLKSLLKKVELTATTTLLTDAPSTSSGETTPMATPKPALHQTSASSPTTITVTGQPGQAAGQLHVVCPSPTKVTATTASTSTTTASPSKSAPSRAAPESQEAIDLDFFEAFLNSSTPTPAQHNTTTTTTAVDLTPFSDVHTAASSFPDTSVNTPRDHVSDLGAGMVQEGGSLPWSLDFGDHGEVMEYDNDFSDILTMRVMTHETLSDYLAMPGFGQR